VIGYHLVFGLSADPVHCGHVALITQSIAALRTRGLDIAQVSLIPVYRRNPVGAAKDDLPESYHHRYIMCGIAARAIRRRLGSPCPQITVSDIEARLASRRNTPNYTVETLTALALHGGQGRRVLLLVSGEIVSGPVPELARWYQPRALLRLATLVICPRSGYRLNRRFVQALLGAGAQVMILPEVSAPPLSSTEVRSQLNAGRSPLALAYHNLIPGSVAHYLARHSVYSG
jgi:nicotinate (nicotinamide) nucleotide adenylyltransferase